MMADQISNDNDVTRPSEAGLAPDPHGQSALLLVERLIHGLLARSIISVTEAVALVETAVEVNAEIAAERMAPIAARPSPPGQIDDRIFILI